jgi:hypothetical protein
MTDYSARPTNGLDFIIFVFSLPSWSENNNPSHMSVILESLVVFHRAMCHMTIQQKWFPLHNDKLRATVTMDMLFLNLDIYLNKG